MSGRIAKGRNAEIRERFGMAVMKRRPSLSPRLLQLTQHLTGGVIADSQPLEVEEEVTVKRRPSKKPRTVQEKIARYQHEEPRPQAKPRQKPLIKPKPARLALVTLPDPEPERVLNVPTTPVERKIDHKSPGKIWDIQIE